MQLTVKETTCICGLTEASPYGEKDGIALVRCSCGIIRVGRLDQQEYVAQYMAGGYHDDHIATVVGKTIRERFQHDEEVAKLRLRAFDRMKRFYNTGLDAGWQVDKPSHTILDVGCGNGAFVGAALNEGFDAYGIDLSPAGWDGVLTFADRLSVADLSDAGYQRRTLDAIFLNDVIEHVIDPKKLLRQACGLLRRDGMLVMDTPDFGHPLEADGVEYHHVKPKEHIWMIDPLRWVDILTDAGFRVLTADVPVGGKVCFYAMPDPDKVLDVEVSGPTGLGDIHWVLLKMAGLKQAEAPCRLIMKIPGYGDPTMVFRSREFLELVPMIDELRMEIADPVIVDSGAEDPAEPIYRLISNGHIERGLRIEEWMPHLETDFNYEIRLPEDVRHAAREIKNQACGRKLVMIYASSDAWNWAITNGKGWTVESWVSLISAMNEEGIFPVLIGKNWDKDFASKLVGGACVDLIGKTSVAQALALFEISDAVIGMCSGITILAAHMGSRSMVFWPERGKIGANMEFHKDFQHDWVDPERLAAGTYIPMSLGTFTVQDVISQLAAWDVLPLVKEEVL